MLGALAAAGVLTALFVWPTDKRKELPHEHPDLPPDHPIGELCDIQADPGEQNNLWNDRQDVVERLVALLEKYQREGRSVSVDHKTLKMSSNRR